MRIAQLFADAVNTTDPRGTDGKPPYGYHRFNGAFVKVAATVGDNGMITTTITDVDFKKPDSTVRVIWHPTAPVPVTDSTDTSDVPSTVGAMDHTESAGAA